MNRVPSKPRAENPYLFWPEDRTSILILLFPAFIALICSGTSKPARHPEDDFAKEYRYQVDINNASAIEMQLLPGIGEKLADSVIQHRETNGPFQNHGDIKKIRGIGPKKLESIKPHLIEFHSVE